MESSKVTLEVPIRPHAFRVMDRLLVQAESLYSDALSDMQHEIETILTRARGHMAKGGGLVIHIDGRDGTLLKAVKAPKASASGPNVKHPGSRGAWRWWKDDHGNVHYGDKPTPRFHREVSDEEAAGLHLKHQTIWSIFGEHGSLPDLLKKYGVDRADMRVMAMVQQHIAEHGGDVEAAFREQFTHSRGKAYSPTYAYSELQNKLRQAVNDPEVQEALKEHVKEAAKAERQFIGDFLYGNAAVMDGQAPDWLHKTEVEAGGLKLLAAGIFNNLIKVVKRRTDVADVDREDWQKYKGRIYVNKDRVGGLRAYVDHMSPEQLLGAALALHVAKDEEGSEEFLKHALTALTNGQSDAEKTDARSKAMLRFKAAAAVIDAWESNQGGESINKLFKDDALLRKVVSTTASNEVKKLRDADIDKAKLVTASLRAQEDTSEAWRPAKGSKLATEIGGKPFTLSPYQNQFVNWMLAVKRGINAADTGLGKTPMTIATVDHLIAEGKEKRGILVMPPALMAQWPKEIEKFRPGSKVVMIDDSIKSAEDRTLLVEAINDGRIEADFVLMSSGVARSFDRSKIEEQAKDLGFKLDAEGNLVEPEGSEGEMDDDARSAMLAKFEAEALKNDPWIGALEKLEGAIFYDEAHSESQGLKTPTNLSARVAKRVIGDREHAFYLTATPVPNTLEDLYHLMDGVHPGSAGASADRFVGKVARRELNKETGKYEIVGFHGLAALNKDIRPYVFHKLKTDPDVVEQMKLPPTVEHEHHLMLYPEQQEFYNRALVEVLKHVDEEGDEAKQLNTLQQISQLRQAAISPKLLDPNYKGRSVKIDHTVNLIKKKFNDPANQHKPIVVFCSFSSAFDVLHEALVGTPREVTDPKTGEKTTVYEGGAGMDASQIGRIASGVSGKERELVQEAANKAKKRIIMVGIKAGGAGLNLQGSQVEDEDGNVLDVGPDEMIYLDKPWSVAALDQSKGRVYRRGQKSTVHTHHLKTVGTYDDDMLQKLAGKLTSAKGVLNAHNGQDVVEDVVQTSFTGFIKDYVDGLESTSKDAFNKEKTKTAFASLPKEHREQLQKTMAGLLGDDNAEGTLDAQLADVLGFRLDSPLATEERKRIKAMSLPEFTKEFFDETGFKKDIRERAYLMAHGQRLKDQIVLNDIKLSKGLVTKKQHSEIKAKLQRDLKLWTVSNAAGRKYKHSEIEDAEYDVKVKETKKRLKAEEGKTFVFHTKQNPYKKKGKAAKGMDEESRGKHERVFDRALKAGATTVRQYMDKVAVPTLKGQGMDADEIKTTIDGLLPMVEEVYETFRKHGVLGEPGTAPHAATEKTA